MQFGLGGGQSYSGKELATTPELVALRPFFGVYGPYKKASDCVALRRSGQSNHVA